MSDPEMEQLAIEGTGQIDAGLAPLVAAGLISGPDGYALVRDLRFALARGRLATLAAPPFTRTMEAIRLSAGRAGQ